MTGGASDPGAAVATAGCGEEVPVRADESGIGARRLPPARPWASALRQVCHLQSRLHHTGRLYVDAGL